MEINTSKTPAVLQTIAQYLAAIIGGWAIRHGYMTADDSQLLVGALLGIGMLGLGVYKTIVHKNRIVEAAVTPVSQIVLK
jgi:hypothetical protein